MKNTNASALEKASGNLIVESALTIVAAIAGGPLAPLLPILGKSLAAERQKKRVEAELAAIRVELESQSALVAALSDEQYKVVNEVVLAILQTTQEQKLKLLRNTVFNSLSAEIKNAQEATMLSRIIRDISAEEATFLMKAIEYNGIHPIAAEPEIDHKNSVIRVDPRSEEYLNVVGLLSFGILAPAEHAYNGMGIMRFTSIASKVASLIRDPVQESSP